MRLLCAERVAEHIPSHTRDAGVHAWRFGGRLSGICRQLQEVRLWPPDPRCQRNPVASLHIAFWGSLPVLRAAEAQHCTFGGARGGRNCHRGRQQLQLCCGAGSRAATVTVTRISVSTPISSPSRFPASTSSALHDGDRRGPGCHACLSSPPTRQLTGQPSMNKRPAWEATAEHPCQPAHQLEHGQQPCTSG